MNFAKFPKTPFIAEHLWVTASEKYFRKTVSAFLEIILQEDSSDRNVAKGTFDETKLRGCSF